MITTPVTSLASAVHCCSLLKCQSAVLLPALADHIIIIGGGAGWGGRPHGIPEPATPDASLTAQSTGPDCILSQNLA